MDITEVISLATKNQQEASSKMKIGYSTSIQAAKKMERTVNPGAIKALLEKRKNEEIQKLNKEVKKKEALQKLRKEAKHTKKAKAMASRTKDNLQIYRGEDYLGLHKEKKRKKQDDQVQLTAEQEIQHKAFMKKISKISNSRQDDDFRKAEPLTADEQHKRRKLEKNLNRSRTAAAGLSFNDLMNLAQNQKAAASSDDSSDSDASDLASSGSDCSDNDLTPQEKYEKERKKRKELEARLKHSNRGVKRKSPSSTPAFKIGKLNTGLTEETKKRKVQSLMAKFKKRSVTSDDQAEPKVKNTSVEKSRASNHGLKPGSNGTTLQNNLKSSSKSQGRPSPARNGVNKPRSGHATSHKQTESRAKNAKSVASHDSKHKRNHAPPSARSGEKGTREQTSEKSSTKPKNVKKGQAHVADKRGPGGDKTQSGDTNLSKKLNMNPYLQAMIKKKLASQGRQDCFEELLAKANKNLSQRPPQCKLTVQSHEVRTNYPGVAQTDPKNASYRKPTGPPPSLSNGYRRTPAEEYRTRALAVNGRPQNVARIFQRSQVLGPEFDDDDDEYDSEMEGFIDDEQGDYDEDISSEIGKIFGYDRNKYGRESEYELSRMDASYKDIQNEEKKSLKIAQQEDAREAKLEEERRKKSMQRKKK